MKTTAQTLEQFAIALCAIVILVFICGCSKLVRPNDNETGHNIAEQARMLQSRFADNISELQQIADDVRNWRSEYKVQASERDLLLSLFARPLAFHSMKPSDASQFGRRFQKIEHRVAQYRRTEYKLAQEFQTLRDRLDRIALANKEDLSELTLQAESSIAALPFRTCPNPQGCDNPGGPRKPCAPFVFDPGRICYLIHEDCQSTFPPGSGWIQQCRYRCIPIGRLF
ncbi:MAG: hypothetical protein P8X96_10740 [Desulfobacteraceae bacterium]